MIDFKENIAQKISEVTNIEKEELKTAKGTVSDLEEFQIVI